MNPPPMPPPVPFGDPTAVRGSNSSAVGKGLFLGCGGCALIVVVVIALGFGVVGFVFHLFRGSDVAQAALAKVQASTAVQAQVGTPMHMGWMFTGSINIMNDTGNANINFPITGPSGSASVHVEAHKDHGVWIFNKLTVKPDNGSKTIYLMAPTGDVI